MALNSTSIDQVLPVALADEAADGDKDQDERHQHAAVDEGEDRDPAADDEQDGHRDHIADDQRPDQRPDEVEMFGHHDGAGLDAEDQECAEQHRHAGAAGNAEEQGRQERAALLGVADAVSGAMTPSIAPFPKRSGCFELCTAWP